MPHLHPQAEPLDKISTNLDTSASLKVVTHKCALQQRDGVNIHENPRAAELLFVEVLA